jgi:hypothetical protein
MVVVPVFSSLHQRRRAPHQRSREERMHEEGSPEGVAGRGQAACREGRSRVGGLLATERYCERLKAGTGRGA